MYADLGVNAENTAYTFICHQKNVGQNHKTNIASISFENMPEFKHLGITLANKTVCIKKL